MRTENSNPTAQRVIAVRFALILIALSVLWPTDTRSQSHAVASDHSFALTVVHGSWADESGGKAPSLVHVRKIDYPGLSDGVWMDEVLVSEDGGFAWELEGLQRPTLFELSAPPWSWMVVIRPHEQAHLELGPGTQAQGLYGTPGSTTWLGSHPSNALDSLTAKQRSLNAEVSAHVMMQMNGASGTALDSMAAAAAVANDNFQNAWQLASSRLTSDWSRDMLWYSKLSWMSGIGAPVDVMDSVVQSSPLQSSRRTIEEKMTSPGWFGAWRQIHGNWWIDDALDWDGINAAIFQADRDSLERSMAAVLDSSTPFALELAWLEMAIVQPSTVVQRAWESIAMADFFQERYDEFQNSRLRGRRGWIPTSPKWILPNGDLDSLGGQCTQPWKVFLIVKDGSSSAAREREYFNAILEDYDGKNLCAFVMSVDADEERWLRTVSKRRSIEEQVVWIGNNPEIFEDFGIQSVPAIVAINDEGELSRELRSLPSRGLERELWILSKKD